MKLTQLARSALESEFLNKDFIPPEEIKKKYSRLCACFVTLKKDGELRGCIGSLAPLNPLWKDVCKNAVSAAFYDPRFLSLTKKELPKIKVEVSVLSENKKLNYKDEKDLLKKINNRMGIILEKNNRTATFLPQVWEEVHDKIKFLEYLSLKAGLEKDAWKTAEIYYYTVEKFEE